MASIEPQSQDYLIEAGTEGERHRGNLIVHDLISLNCKLWLLAGEVPSKNDQTNVAKRILSILHNGSQYTLPSNVTSTESFFTGGGRFLKKSGDSWTEVANGVAMQVLCDLLEEALQMLEKAGYGEEPEQAKDEAEADGGAKATGEEEEEDAAKVASPDKRSSPRREKRQKNNAGEPVIAPLPSAEESKDVVTSKPNIDDVVLLDRKDATEKTYVDHAGNAFLILEISQFFSDQYMLSKSVIKGTRADAALATAYSLLGPIKDVGGDGTNATKTRFLMRPEDATFLPTNKKEGDETWKILTYTGAAEFILMLLFDKLVDKENIAALLERMPTSTDAASVAANTAGPSTVPVKQFTDNDVLFGRGGLTNSHPGNRRFRDIILLHRPDYARAIKIEKPNVARRIVKAIRCGSPPGHFLKKDPKNGMWYDVGDRHAAEKTSQALREKTQAEKAVRFDEDKRKRLREGGLSQLASQRGVRSYPILPMPALSPADLQQMVQAQLVPGMTMAGLPMMGAYGPYAILPSAAANRDETKAISPPDGTASAGVADPAAASGVLAVNNCDQKSAADQERVDAEGNILVTDADIISGRGGRSNHHQGNKRFRDIVALHRPDYVRAAKIHKPAVARMIVRALKNNDPPGRFLKKDEKTGKYCELSDKKAAEKVSQALREKTPLERERLKHESGMPASYFANAALVQLTQTLIKNEVPGLGGPAPVPATGTQPSGAAAAPVTPVEGKPSIETASAAKDKEKPDSSPKKKGEKDSLLEK